MGRRLGEWSWDGWMDGNTGRGDAWIDLPLTVLHFALPAIIPQYLAPSTPNWAMNHLASRKMGKEKKQRILYYASWIFDFPKFR
jgi:hypothetical protein